MFKEVSNLYFFLIAWCIFSTLVSFIAAFLFWNKGKAVVSGEESVTSQISWNLTGAGAIFIVVLLIFLWINPVKPLAEYRRLIIFHSDNYISDVEKNILTNFAKKINDGNDFWRDFNTDNVAADMVPADYIYHLAQTDDGRGLRTSDEIPQGEYLIRAYIKDIGGYKTRIIKVR